MRARGLRLLALGALVAALTACSATATVTVRMHDDGSGVVSVRVVLDAAAVRTAEVGGGALADRVRLADLPGAGWTVTPWRKTSAGGAVLTVAKPFTRPEQVADIVREISGAHGPLRGFRASRSASTFSQSWRVSGKVDLRTLDLGIAADPQLVKNLTDQRVDVAGIETRIEASARSGLRVHARAELPGGTQEVGTRPGKQAVLAAATDHTDVGRIALVALGVVVGVLAVLLLAVGELRGRRRRSRRSVRSRP